MTDRQELAARVLSGDQRPLCPFCGSGDVIFILRDDDEDVHLWGCPSCDQEPWSTPVVFEHPVTFLVSVWPQDCRCPDASTWCLTIARRNARKWAVLRGSGDSSICLGSDGTFTPDEVPSGSRRGEWLAAHRFSLEEARRVARFYAPSILIAGLTAAEVLAEHKRKFPGGCGA